MNNRRPLRLLMFTATLGYGGAESAFMRLACFLAQRMDVTIALMARDYGSKDYSSAQTETELPVVILDVEQVGPVKSLCKPFRWFRMLWQLRKLKQQHDVTISFLSGPNLLNALAGPTAATIISERGSKLYHVGIPPFNKWLWLRLLDPLTYRLAGAIVPASKGYSEEIADIAGPRQSHKIFPIEGGIDATQLVSSTDADADLDIINFCTSPTAVYCGRIDRGKGIDHLIPIFANVYGQNSAARLLIIGDGPLREELLALCARLGLSVTENGDRTAAVFFAGYRAEPARHYRFCRVFCFTSLHEGLGNSLIEGVASGIPVLAADCRWGPRSILSDCGGEEMLKTVTLPLKTAHGTLMPLPDTSAGAAVWSEALAHELEAPPRRRGFDERLLAVRRFDLAETGEMWISLIEKMARAHKNETEIRTGNT